MKISPSLVSIIIPNYNQGPYLNEALESVLHQTYDHWECIVIDDGSTDSSEDIIQEWLKNPNEKFQYLKQQNKGVCAARNKAISLAKGEWILPLDADDKISYNYIEECLKTAEKHPNAQVFYGNGVWIGERQGPWNLPEFDLELIKHGNIIHCSGMYRKKDWQTVGGYDVNMIDGLEDWEFWIAILKSGGKAVKVSNATLYYRIKPNSRNNELTENKRKLSDMRKYIFDKHTSFILEDPYKIYSEWVNYKLYKNELHLLLTFKELFTITWIKIKVQLYGVFVALKLIKK